MLLECMLADGAEAMLHVRHTLHNRSNVLLRMPLPYYYSYLYSYYYPYYSCYSNFFCCLLLQLLVLLKLFLLLPLLLNSSYCYCSTICIIGFIFFSDLLMFSYAYSYSSLLLLLLLFLYPP